ncbi:MFS transporter [Natronorarus salvus]|uniref:MFS transporter n=1 Tax=Natronorarus salvus TaxID=3117733 RepID=UPI002F25F60A
MESPREERLFEGPGGRMLLALSLGNATIALGTLVLSPLLPTIIDSLAAGLAVAAIAMLSWRAAFLPVLLFAVGVALLVHRFSVEPYRVSRVGLDVRGTGRRLLGDGHVRLVLLAYSLYLFTWQGAVSFLPTLLQLERGFSPVLAGGGFAVLFVIGIVVKPLSGGVGDRLGRTRVAFGALVTGAVGLAILILAPSASLVVVGIVVFAVGMMAFSPPMLAYVMSIFPTASAGGDFGAVRTIYLGIGASGRRTSGWSRATPRPSLAWSVRSSPARSSSGD